MSFVPAFLLSVAVLVIAVDIWLSFAPPPTISVWLRDQGRRKWWVRVVYVTLFGALYMHFWHDWFWR